MGNTVVRCASSEAMHSDPRPINVSPSQQEGSDKARYDKPPSNNMSGFQAPLENNPGTMDELHKKCKEVFPICFDGGKVMINKGLSNHFQISHTVNLSTMAPGYRFGATYVGMKQSGPQEAFPVMLADIDPSGNVSTTMIHQFADRIRCKFASQIQKSQIVAAQGTTEYRSPVATYSVTVANPDLVGESGLLVGSYLRRVRPNLDLGAEIIYQCGPQIPGNQLSVLQYSARYTGQNFVASGSFGRSLLHLCYYHKQQENLQFGVEWETNLRMGESTATFGYQLEIPKAHVLFRASIDTNGIVGGTLEKKLLPLPFTLALSGNLNHAQSKSRFGIGLVVG